MEYKIKLVNELSDLEIKLMLVTLEDTPWFNLNSEEFKDYFKTYEFHFLYQENTLLAVARLLPNFKFKIEEKNYEMYEMVGLVALVKAKGYGKELLLNIVKSVKSRDIETISSCFKHNRGFYEKCGIEIFLNKGPLFLEKDENGKWIETEDDDILNINLKDSTRLAIISLTKENPAYLDL